MENQVSTFGHIFWFSRNSRFETTLLSSWLAGLVTRILSRSSIVHCAFAYNDICVDRSVLGTRFYPVRFICQSKRLAAFARVQLKFPVNLQWWEREKQTSIPYWPSIRRMLVGGGGPWPDDCLTCVMDNLLAGGVEVPRRVTTPAKLLIWMKQYPHATVYQRSDRHNGQLSAYFSALTDLAGRGVSCPDAERKGAGHGER